MVFLVLPQFFSKRGRQALLAYAFILAITGPAKNTLNNMGILTDSLACGEVNNYLNDKLLVIILEYIIITAIPITTCNFGKPL